MKILLSGGGTGGHIYPAIAIAEAFEKRYKDCEVAFVGSPRGMENKLIPQTGHKLYTIDIMGISRKLTVENIKVAVKILKAKKEARKLLCEYKPDIVIGTGGYASWPAVSQAAKLGIPTAIVEQDAFPGIATRQLAKCADRVFLSFEKTREYIDGKTKKGAKIIISGNPLRMNFASASKDVSRAKLGINKPYILSLGGSLGALKINECMLDVMKDYSAKNDILHTHACGSRDYKTIKERFDSMGLSEKRNIHLAEYIYDMPDRMAAADLVINRSGAITLAELAMLGKPCILIPSPNVTADHQYKNAKVLADAGAAVLIKDDELTPERLIKEINAIISSKEKQKTMSENIKKFAHPNSLYTIINEAEKLISEKNKGKK